MQNLEKSDFVEDEKLKNGQFPNFELKAWNGDNITNF